MDHSIPTQRTSLARFLTVGIFSILVPAVSGAQQVSGDSFITENVVITAPFPLSQATTTATAADLLQRPSESGDSANLQKTTTTIYEDGFEGGIPASWAVSGDGGVFWGDTAFRSHLGSRSVWCAGGGPNAQPDGGDYANDMNAWMIFGPFSLSEAVAGSMSFWLWQETEIYNDSLFWGVSSDGNSFSGVRRGSTTAEWGEQIFDFDASALGDSSVWVAFVFRSDGSNTMRGAYIDDIVIEKTTQSAQPDLVVQSTSVSNSTPTVGESFTINTTVRNQGASTSGSSTLRYYRSSDNMISSSDTLIGTDPVSGLTPGGTSPENMVTSIDSSGTFWVGACVDSVVGESNPNNNCSSGVRVDVGGGGGGGGGGTGDGDYNYFLAAIVHSPGVGHSLWKSKVAALNRSGSPADVTCTYYWKNGPTTVKSMSVKQAIAHGRLETWDDAAVDLFGISNNSSGSVLFNSTEPLVVTARTYTVGEGGSFGSFLPGVAVGDGVKTGEVGILTQLTGNKDFRTNVGQVNLSDKYCQTKVQVRTANGIVVGSEVTTTLGAHMFDQINDIFAETGAGQRNNAYVTVQVVSHDCEVWAYAAVIDGTDAFPGTNDPTIIPLTVIDE